MPKKSSNPSSGDIPQFEDPFKDLLPGYIQYKRAQGYKLSRAITCRLREMDVFFLEIGLREIRITREMYDAWTAHKPGQKETTTQKRQSTIGGFAKYLVSLGYQDIYTGYDDTRIFKRTLSRMCFLQKKRTGCSGYSALPADSCPAMKTILSVLPS